jgi:hypothetical protein
VPLVAICAVQSCRLGGHTRDNLAVRGYWLLAAIEQIARPPTVASVVKQRSGCMMMVLVPVGTGGVRRAFRTVGSRASRVAASAVVETTIDPPRARGWDLGPDGFLPHLSL